MSREQLIELAEDTLRTYCTGDDPEQWSHAERLAMAVLEYFGKVPA